MTDFLSTVSYIGYHAAVAPTQVAVVEGGRGVSYREFHRDIGKMTGALREMGVEAGEAVAVEVTGFYRHWIMLLACEALGAATLSYNASEAGPIGGRFAAMDRAICSSEAALADIGSIAAEKIHIADQDWLAGVARREPETLPPSIKVDADAPLRIVKSYGTTGVLELMTQTGQIHDFWLRQFRFRATLDRKSRYLLTAGFGVQAFHVHATSCIRMGGTCVCGNPNEIAADIGRYGITHATFIPAQLEKLLAGQGAAPLEPRMKQVFTIGGTAAKPVRDRARQILVDEISESYGTNEAGGICSMDDDGIGTVFPGVEVQVLDDTGNPVFGSPGQIRLRSEGVVTGYLGDPETSARMFRDGWFHPGDIAVLYDQRRLTLAGRIEDYLDISGVKHSLDALEKVLLEGLPAKDLCLLSASPATNGGTEVTLMMLILAEGRQDADAIRRKAISLLPDGIDRFTVVEARNIPRGTDGRVQRAKLGWQLKQALTGQQQD